MNSFKPLVVTTSRGDRDLSDLAQAMRSEGVGDNWYVLVPTTALLLDGIPQVNLRRVRQGGYASPRNEALQMAISSEWTHLVFFDDDQLPVAGWLEAFRSYHCANPHIEILVGPVLEVSVGGPSAAVAEDIRPMDSERAGPLQRPGNSGNTCIAIEWLRSSRLVFDTSLDAIGGEDTRFFTAALARNARVHLVPKAKAVEFASTEKRSIRAMWNSGRALGQRRRALGPPHYRPILTSLKASMFGSLHLLRGMIVFDRRLIAKGVFQIGIARGK